MCQQVDSVVPADTPIQAIRSDLVVINRKIWMSQQLDLVIPADYRIKMKQSEKRHKYLDLTRELK